MFLSRDSRFLFTQSKRLAKGQTDRFSALRASAHLTSNWKTQLCTPLLRNTIGPTILTHLANVWTVGQRLVRNEQRLHHSGSSTRVELPSEHGFRTTGWCCHKGFKLFGTPCYHVFPLPHGFHFWQLPPKQGAARPLLGSFS